MSSLTLDHAVLAWRHRVRKCGSRKHGSASDGKETLLCNGEKCMDERKIYLRLWISVIRVCHTALLRRQVGQTNPPIGTKNFRNFRGSAGTTPVDGKRTNGDVVLAKAIFSNRTGTDPTGRGVSLSVSVNHGEPRLMGENRDEYVKKQSV